MSMDLVMVDHPLPLNLSSQATIQDAQQHLRRFAASASRPMVQDLRDGSHGRVVTALALGSPGRKLPRGEMGETFMEHTRPGKR